MFFDLAKETADAQPRLTGTSTAILNNLSITTQYTNGNGVGLATSFTASFSGTIITNGTGAKGVFTADRDGKIKFSYSGKVKTIAVKAKQPLAVTGRDF